MGLAIPALRWTYLFRWREVGAVWVTIHARDHWSLNGARAEWIHGPAAAVGCHASGLSIKDRAGVSIAAYLHVDTGTGSGDSGVCWKRGRRWRWWWRRRGSPSVLVGGVNRYTSFLPSFHTRLLLFADGTALTSFHCFKVAIDAHRTFIDGELVTGLLHHSHALPDFGTRPYHGVRPRSPVGSIGRGRTAGPTVVLDFQSTEPIGSTLFAFALTAMWVVVGNAHLYRFALGPGFTGNGNLNDYATGRTLTCFWRDPVAIYLARAAFLKYRLAILFWGSRPPRRPTVWIRIFSRWASVGDGVDRLAIRSQSTGLFGQFWTGASWAGVALVLGPDTASDLAKALDLPQGITFQLSRIRLAVILPPKTFGVPATDNLIEAVAWMSVL